MISNIVVSLFGAAYNWPLGAAISLGMLVIVVEPAVPLREAGKEVELLDERRAIVPAPRWLSDPRRRRVCISLSSDRVAHPLLVQPPRRRRISAPPSHSDWYRILFADDAIWESVLNSLKVAFAAMAIALAFGIPAALALDRAQFPGKALFRRLVLLPLILPGIITGLSLLMLFNLAAQAQPADHCSGTRNGSDFGGHDGSFRGTAETRSRAGRGVARFRREPTGKRSGASPCPT